MGRRSGVACGRAARRDASYKSLKAGGVATSGAFFEIDGRASRDAAVSAGRAPHRHAMSSLLEDSFIAAPTPGGAAGPAHAAHDVEICGEPTKIALTAYSNRVFVVVTQTDNLGTLIAAERDLAIDPTCTCYSTRVLLGRRDDETLEVYARTMVELVAKRVATDAPPLLLAISIKEHSPETFKAVMKFVEEHRVW